MTATDTLTAAEVRRRVGHPIVDGDGHFLEFMPLVNDEITSYLEESGGTALAERFRTQVRGAFDTAVFQADRTSPEVLDRWASMPSWWGNPTIDARERATAHLPALMYERLDELGIDLMCIYPSWTLGFVEAGDDEMRAHACRGVNRYISRVFAGYEDRFVPAAVIPMDTPEMAIGELRHAAEDLGMKSVVLAGNVARPVPAGGARLDVFGLDSAHDYDPVWATCVELGLAPAFHSSLQYSHSARSVSSYVYNHVGGIAGAHTVLCKALFLGGVLRRHPALRIGFLEGGVAWAASLLADLVGHWNKRGGHAIADLDPDNLDVAAVLELVGRYGDDQMKANLDRIGEYLGRRPGRPQQLDEFADAGVTSVEDILEPFENRLFFGCEADDPLVGFTFGLDLEGTPATLRPILGSDVSHWDAPVMGDVMVEAYELMEHGVLTPEQFKAFTFDNPVLLHGGANPDFFVGTPVERQAGALLDASAGS
jgi:predicted TIM-barrel fold metal-dependent hydrolase